MVYSNICRGLFNTHKLIFSFIIAARILLNSKNISIAEWDLLLKGVVIDGNVKSIKNPEPSIISEKAWKFILNLECANPAAFSGLPKDIVDSS